MSLASDSKCYSESAGFAGFTGTGVGLVAFGFACGGLGIGRCVFRLINFRRRVDRFNRFSCFGFACGGLSSDGECSVLLTFAAGWTDSTGLATFGLACGGLVSDGEDSGLSTFTVCHILKV